MPTRPKPYCLSPGCGRRVASGHCPEHRPSRPSSTAQGYGADWRRLRQTVPKTPCRQCGEPWRPFFHLDHIEPRRDRLARGVDPDALGNLQWLCRRCHSRKTRIWQNAQGG